MRRVFALFLSLCFLTAGCGRMERPPVAPETPEAALSEEYVSNPEIADSGLQIVIPEEHLDALIVITEFPDVGAEEHQIPLLAVYEKASVEALEQDYGSSEGGGFLFGIAQLDQAGLEEHLLNDYGGMRIFARDEAHYYAMTHPTDVQFYRSGGSVDICSEDWADWEALSALGDDVCQDFLYRNGLEPYSTAAFYQEPFTYEGAHAYAIFYPYQTFDGSLAERYTLVLSQPAGQGEGGLWCVERWYDQFGTCYLNFPANGQASAEYYAALQAECDAGDHAELLIPLGAAKAFVEHSFWFEKEATEENVVLTDCIDSDYIRANQSMSQTIRGLLARPETVTDTELLSCIGGFQESTWGVMGRYCYGSDWWPPLQEGLSRAAVGEDQANRNRSMMRFYLTSYGRYAEFISGILREQRAADPTAFEEVLTEFDQEAQLTLREASL